MSPSGDEGRERIVEDHEASSEPVAGDGVADRQREEAERDGQHDEVQHFDAPGRLAPCELAWCDARPIPVARARDSTARHGTANQECEK